MKTISAKIPDDDYRVLESLAEEVPRHSKAAVVRAAVNEYCKKHVVGMQRKSEVLQRTKGAFKHAPLDAKKHRESISERMI